MTTQINGTSLKRVWKFDGTPVFEKYEIKDNQKNNNEQQTSKSSLNSPNNPFANANGQLILMIKTFRSNRSDLSATNYQYQQNSKGLYDVVVTTLRYLNKLLIY